MAGYTRVDTSNNIADGNVISAADLDNEFDGIQAAFNASTGHNHDGTTGEGAPILVLGPTQDVVVSALTVTPKTTNTVDIGSSSLKFKDLFLAGNASIAGTLAVTGVATLTANPVMSGGTANGVAYLNGSKVLTTGSALTFDGTNLGLGVTASAVTHGPHLEVGSTRGTVSIGTGYIEDNGTTQFFNGVRPLAFGISGTEGMRLTSTGLGIGTSSPTNALSVTGNANITGNVTLGDATTDTVTVNGYVGQGTSPSGEYGYRMSYTGSTATAQYGFFVDAFGSSAATASVTGLRVRARSSAAAYTMGSAWGLFVDGAGLGAGSTITNAVGLFIQDQTVGTNNYGVQSAVSSGTNKWNIYASGTAANYFAGNVGIGTTAPAYKLDVVGDIQAQGRLLVTALVPELLLSVPSGGLDSRIYNDGSGNLIFGNGTNSATPTERMRIDASGNVGIGTSSPVGNLDVAGITPTLNIRDTQSKTWAAGDTVGTLDFYSNDTSGVGAQAVSRIRSVADTASAATSGALAFWTAAAGAAATEKLRITSAGNVGINTTAPNCLLYVASTANPTTIPALGAASNHFAVGNTNAYGTMFGTLNVGTGYIQQQRFDGTATAYNLSLQPNGGNVGIGTSSPSASAILDAQSTTKGVRMPNMTTAQKNAIASPAAGLMVFDTTLSKLCVYTGAAWQTITSI